MSNKPNLLNIVSLKEGQNADAMSFYTTQPAVFTNHNNKKGSRQRELQLTLYVHSEPKSRYPFRNYFGKTGSVSYRICQMCNILIRLFLLKYFQKLGGCDKKYLRQIVSYKIKCLDDKHQAQHMSQNELVSAEQKSRIK